MAQTQIHGSTQIQANTVTSGQVDSSVIIASGSHAFTGEVAGITPTSSTHLATKGYVDGVAQGLSTKASVQAATTGSETYTIAGGSVTQINGTTLDGVTVAIGDRILVKDAPGSSGTGSVGSDQPANGIYTVTGNTTNLTVARAADVSGSVNPAGAFTLIEAGTANKGMGYVVIDPTTSDGTFTYGSNNIEWSIFSSAGSGVSSVSVTSANGFAGTVANSTTTPAITLSTSVTGLLKGNGTAVSAATAGTDYLGPSNRSTRETPTGSINGSNTTFTLANTPLSGTEEVFLNGILQDAGAGNDYTISSATITMLSAPLSGDKIRVTYWHS
jgi:hypothetical protein